jgi:hypothetical protein
LRHGESPADEPQLKTNRWKKNTIMNDVFHAGDKNQDHAANGPREFAAALHGEVGRINYREFGHWVDMADEAESAEEFEHSVLQEQGEHLKNYVIKRNDIKGRGADYTDEEKTTIAKGTVRNEFRKRTGMSFQEFFANVKADSAAASA